MSKYQKIVINIRNTIAFVRNIVVFIRTKMCLTHFNIHVQHQSCDNDFRSHYLCGGAWTGMNNISHFLIYFTLCQQSLAHIQFWNDIILTLAVPCFCVSGEYRPLSSRPWGLWQLYCWPLFKMHQTFECQATADFVLNIFDSKAPRCP